MYLKLSYLLVIAYLFTFPLYGQDVSLLRQYNGRYDFTFIGNTMNPTENSYMSVPVINTASSAVLNLTPGLMIENAYLYWAGCGTGDYEVKLNGTTITPERIFSHQRTSNGVVLDYFSSFTDVTAQVQATGNGTYTLSDLDLNPWIQYYFQSSTNFGGWAIIVIYKSSALTLNQLNVYDGLQAVPNTVSITLNSLNVIDNQNSKIGFLAWEGDRDIAIGESLTINGNLISNLPLNPVNNAFNGTNSFTNNSNLYNMDLDVYALDNNIHIGDTAADIVLRSGRDFVMVNAIVTKLNSQLPDAIIAANRVSMECNSRTINVYYRVTNFQATGELPAQTPIAVYLNGTYVQSTTTQNVIPVDGSEEGMISLNIPSAVPTPFDVTLVVDDDGTGHGSVNELQENNNSFTRNVALFTSAPLRTLENLVACNEGMSVGTFDFSSYESLIKLNSSDVVTFYPTLADFQNETNPIVNLSNYIAPATPMEIFVKVDNGTCFNMATFTLTTKKCQPIVYNFISANNDGTNDTFHIKGLRDVFLNYRLDVFNRWGKLVWTGYNDTPEWDGFANKGTLIGNSEIATGTYYYVLELNDPDYPKPLVGYLFLNR